MPYRLALALGLALALVSQTAGAVEREHQVGLDLGGSVLAESGMAARLGMALGVNYTYGLTDQFNLMAEAGATDFFGTPTAGPTRAGRFGVGAAYVLDVTRLVPYFGVLVEGVVLDGGAEPKPLFRPAAGLALGADFHIDRRFAVGLAVREHFILSWLSMDASHTELFFRGAWIFGW